MATVQSAEGKLISALIGAMMLEGFPRSGVLVRQI